MGLATACNLDMTPRDFEQVWAIHERLVRQFSRAGPMSPEYSECTGWPYQAQSGASLADLKARMGHDSDRAALIYQHATRDADERIADAQSTRVEAEQKKIAKGRWHVNGTNAASHDQRSGVLAGGA
ncbi:hypothetical protein ABZ815_02765 [Nonomuraea sp. NPDC047529]|uniref:hypothetical protein n=1 Tax=Nonomuraea sp. NPDC047529 TaxID=3155623 RepID=UPI0033DBDCD4